MSFSQSIAVVIGINRYQADVPTLRSAVNDASRIADTLQKQHGYRSILLLDEQATLTALLDLVERQLPESVGANDRVLFYFAGHGVAVSGDDGPQGFLLPQDARRGNVASYLEMTRLNEGLMSLPCRHMLVILDSCFSGAFRWSARRDASFELPTVYQERFDRFLRDPAWQLITSAAYDQTAADQWGGGDFGNRGEDGVHSPFAEALLDGLVGAADLVPKDGDGVITATELYMYLEDRLQPKSIQYGTRQTPGLWPLRKHDKGEFIFLVPGVERRLPSAPVLTGDTNPYRGLAAFETRHADVFFGRDPAINALVAKICSQLLTVVLGASGTGKSSLVKAGVVPRMANEHKWRILPLMRPGSNPLRALQTALGNESVGAQPASFESALARLLAATEAPLLLIIDQFEELLTMTRSADQRAACLDQLAALLEQADGRLHLVLTLRSDFEALFDHSPLAPIWQAGRFVVPPMSRADLRAAIEGPALERVLYFEPSSLVDQLVDEVAAMPGGLPLLSFTLAEMYLRYIARASDDRCLTQADYEALGGVVGALRSRADAELAELDTAQQATLRRLMLRMLRVQHGALVRQRVSASQLLNKDAQESERLQQVLTRLVGARLVVRGVDDQGQAFVEPAHDALVSSWGQLLQWTHEAQDHEPDLPFLHALQRNAEEWSNAGPTDRPGLLWRDKLRSRRLWSLRRKEPFQLSQVEDRFCRASIARWRFLRNTAIGLVAAIALFGLLAGALGLIASERRDQADQRRIEAERQTRLAQANALTAAARGAIDGEGDATLGFKLAAAALTLEPGHEPALWLMRKALYGSGFIADRGSIISTPFTRKLGEDVGEVVWSPDGRHIATWHYDGEDSGLGTVTVFSNDGEQRSQTLVQRYTGAQFDSTGRYLIWPEEGDEEPQGQVALDLDGHRVSAATLATLKPWTSDNRELAFEGYDGTPFYRVSSADGRVRAGILTVDKANPATNELEFGIEVDGVRSSTFGGCNVCPVVAIRSDGSLIATADWKGEVLLWKASKVRQHAQPVAVLRRAGGGETRVPDLKFSPDGSRLLARDWRGDAWFWEIGWITFGHAEQPDKGQALSSPKDAGFAIDLNTDGLSADSPNATLTVTNKANGRQWSRVFASSEVRAGLKNGIITVLDDFGVFLLDVGGTQSIKLPINEVNAEGYFDVLDPQHPISPLFNVEHDGLSLNVPLSVEAMIDEAREKNFLETSLDEQARWSVIDAIAAQSRDEAATQLDSTWAVLKRRLGIDSDSGPDTGTPVLDPAGSKPASTLDLPPPWQALLEQTPQPAPPINPEDTFQPIRNIAADLRDAGLLSALQAMSPPAIYLSGPHDAKQWNAHSEQFAHYNPAFIQWLSDSLLPASRDTPLRIATQPAYDRHVRRFARMQAVTWRALNDRPALRDEILARYAGLQSGRGEYLLKALQPLADALDPVDEGEPADVTQAAGFWIRRMLDGTAPLFDRALRHALDCYDPDFAAALHLDQAAASKVDQ
jgi:hypothetical protein